MNSPSTSPEPIVWTALVLAGGSSRRLGHDKARATIAGRSLLQHVLDSIPADVPCLVVGPPADMARPAEFVSEEEPGGGPVSGIAAGLPEVTTPFVAVLAVDMPFAGGVVARLVGLLAASGEDVDAVIRLDAEGNRQPLAGAYRTAALRSAMLALEVTWGRSMRDLACHLRVLEVPADADEEDRLIDIDTPADLERARRSLHGTRTSGPSSGGRMDDWAVEAARVLGIEVTVDVDLVLNVARDAAHAVARPAAPVTTFLLGYAAASGLAPEEAAERLAALARDWPQHP